MTQCPESRENIGFAPVGVDMPYRVFTAKDPLGFKGGDTNLFGYIAGDPMDLVDPSGLWTIGIGVTINIQWGPVNFTGSVGFVFDGSGNVGIYKLVGGGLGEGGAISVGLTGSASNAKNICDLSGPFNQGSLGGGWGPDASGDYYTGNSPDGWVTGGGITVGAGLGEGGSAGGSRTWITPLGHLW